MSWGMWFVVFGVFLIILGSVFGGLRKRISNLESELEELKDKVDVIHGELGCMNDDSYD